MARTSAAMVEGIGLAVVEGMDAPRSDEGWSVWLEFKLVLLSEGGRLRERGSTTELSRASEGSSPGRTKVTVMTM